MSNNQEQYSLLDKKYVEQCLADNNELYNKFNQVIDEEIDKTDSYAKLAQIKRSIDSLIEILYDHASFVDIEIELETTKHTQAKLELQKRIQEKKRKAIESIIDYIATQQQKTKSNLDDSNNLNHKQETGVNVSEIKEKLKLQMKKVLFAVLANGMDPEQRAGETGSSNAKHAHKYGRMENGGEHQNSNIFSALLKMLFNVLFNINVDISSHMPFTAKIKMENRNKKEHGVSI